MNLIDDRNNLLSPPKKSLEHHTKNDRPSATNQNSAKPINPSFLIDDVDQYLRFDRLALLRPRTNCFELLAVFHFSEER